jgi:DNA primase
MQRNHWLAVLLAIVIFCSGIGAGVLWHRYYVRTAPAKPPSEDFRHHYVSEMRSRLDLTDSQVDQLNVILDETKARYKAARDSVRPALVKIKEQQISRVKGILTPKQVPIYEHMVAEHERRAHEQEERENREESKSPGAHHGPHAAQ